jgi:hypothetical protein
MNETITLTPEVFATFTVEIPDVDSLPRDSRDWRNVRTEDRPKRNTRRQPRRQNTRQAVLQAYAREGGF